ncbi:MAG TPA: DUF167 domain-containing protein [Phycisphaerae bacterium]|nr:DUF167 domain-containing protein [Phycisphaerae bacterium]
MGACYRIEGDVLILNVKVRPRAGRAGLGRIVGDALQVYVAEAPEHGKATDAVLKMLAEIFGVRPGSVTLLSGALKPRKVVRIKSPAAWPAILGDCVNI